MNNEKIFKEYIDNVIKCCTDIYYSDIKNIYEILVKTNNDGGKIYICGNGGSASTASHFQTDLNKAFSLVKGTMPAYCLADNVSTITAAANDYSYDDVFTFQLKCLLEENDVLIAISGSGNSNNVIKAAEYTKNKGNIVISMVGFNGGKLKTLSDYSFHVSVNNMQITEDLHVLFSHLVSTMIRECMGK